VLGPDDHLVAAWDVTVLAPSGGRRDLVLPATPEVQARRSYAGGTVSSGIRDAGRHCGWRIEHPGYLDLIPAEEPMPAEGVQVVNASDQTTQAVLLLGGIPALAAALDPGDEVRFQPERGVVLTVCADPPPIGSLHRPGSLGDLSEPHHVDQAGASNVQVRVLSDSNGLLHFEQSTPDLLARFGPAQK